MPSVPKPTPREKKPRKPIARNQRPLSRSPITPKRTPIPKTNPERQAKKRVRYRINLAKYKKSACYKAVEARAGGQCERIVKVENVWIRCPNTRADGYVLTHNHSSYFGFGGMEAPEHVEVICKPHNDLYESEKRPWNRGRKK